MRAAPQQVKTRWTNYLSHSRCPEFPLRSFFSHPRIPRKTSLQRNNFKTLWISSQSVIEEQLWKSNVITSVQCLTAVRPMAQRAASINTLNWSTQAHSKSVRRNRTGRGREWRKKPEPTLKTIAIRARLNWHNEIFTV